MTKQWIKTPLYLIILYIGRQGERGIVVIVRIEEIVKIEGIAGIVEKSKLSEFAG